VMNKAWLLLLLAALFVATAPAPASAFWSADEDGDGDGTTDGNDAAGDADADSGVHAGVGRTDGEDMDDSADANDAAQDETPEEKEARELEELKAKNQKVYEEKMAAWELEIQDPKYDLDAIKLNANLACSACNNITTRLGDAVLSVTYKARDKSLKERRLIAESIVDTVCDGLVDVEMTGEGTAFTLHSNDLKFDLETLALKKKKLKKKKKKKKKNDEDVEDEPDAEEEGIGDAVPNETSEEKKDGEDAEVEAEAEGRKLSDEGEDDETDSAEDEADEDLPPSGNEEDTEYHRSICKLMLANHGSKLKSNISGFYKDVSGSSLRKKLCYQWQDVCLPPAKTKLSKREKCLMKVFKATADSDWEAVDKYIECAQAELKVKKKKKKKKMKTEDASADETDVEADAASDAEADATPEAGTTSGDAKEEKEEWEDI